MRLNLLLLAAGAVLLHTAHAAPQFITFKDGKVGVNFGGYHAEAGLGGLLTGNAAHGGLSASAGTPWGPQAAAGLGGNLNGRTSGLLYAGAQANPSVGASAVLGGSAGEQGFAGSEAHANGRMHTSTKTIGPPGGWPEHVAVAEEPQQYQPVTGAPDTSPHVETNVVQKVKPPKKYNLIRTDEQQPSVTAATEPPKHHKPATQNSAHDDAIQPAVANDDLPPIAWTPTNQILIHRQRMRERRRQQLQYDQQQQQVANERECKRWPRKCSMRARQLQQEQQQQQQQQHAKHVQRTKIVTKSIVSDAAAVLRPAVTSSSHTKINNVPKKHVEVDHQIQHAKNMQNSIHKYAGPSPVPAPGPCYNCPPNANAGIINSALNIPIGILRSLQESLSGLGQAAVHHNGVN